MPGTQATTQLASPQNVSAWALLILLSTAAGAAPPAWDCRATADGSGWQCEQAARPTGAARTPEVPDTDGADAPAARLIDDSDPAGPGANAIRPDASPRETPASSAQPRTVTPGPSDSRPPAVTADSPTLGPTAEPATPKTPSTAARAQTTQRDPVEPAGGAQQYPALLEPTQGGSVAGRDTAIVASAGAETGLTSAAAGGGPGPLDIDSGIDWENCSNALDAAPQRPSAVMAYDNSLPIEVSAEGAVAELTPEQATFSGSVDLLQGDMRMQAEELHLDRITGEVKARGDVLLSRPDVRVSVSYTHLTLPTIQL